MKDFIKYVLAYFKKKPKIMSIAEEPDAFLEMLFKDIDDIDIPDVEPMEIRLHKATVLGLLPGIEVDFKGYIRGVAPRTPDFWNVGDATSQFIINERPVSFGVCQQKNNVAIGCFSVWDNDYMIGFATIPFTIPIYKKAIHFDKHQLKLKKSEINLY